MAELGAELTVPATNTTDKARVMNVLSCLSICFLQIRYNIRVCGFASLTLCLELHCMTRGAKVQAPTNEALFSAILIRPMRMPAGFMRLKRLEQEINQTLPTEFATRHRAAKGMDGSKDVTLVARPN